MSSLSDEVRNIQNPALGAVILWQFALGYEKAHPDHTPVPLLMLFLPIPMMVLKETRGIVSGTNRPSGLRACATKFGETKTSKQDLLVMLHEHVSQLRNQTLDALRLAITTKLLHVSVEGYALSTCDKKLPSNLFDDARDIFRNSHKLGEWCGELGLYEVASILHMRF